MHMYSAGAASAAQHEQQVTNVAVTRALVTVPASMAEAPVTGNPQVRRAFQRIPPVLALRRILHLALQLTNSCVWLVPRTMSNARLSLLTSGKQNIWILIQREVYDLHGSPLPCLLS